jgi:HSP20 family protein
MATTRTWDPFAEMLRLRESMNRLMEGSIARPSGTLLGFTEPFYAQTFPLNIHGTADELKVEALLPGISQEDVQIDVDRGVLTIGAKRHGPETAEGEQWHLREFNPGQFTRSVSLPYPVDVERAGATFTNGVLTLTLPKAEAAKPKRIQVGGGQRSQLGAGDAAATEPIETTATRSRAKRDSAHN